MSIDTIGICITIFAAAIGQVIVLSDVKNHVSHLEDRIEELNGKYNRRRRKAKEATDDKG